MNRTTLRKIVYVILLFAVFGALAWLWKSGKISTVALVVTGIGLLLLGRIINYPLRHFYRGLRAFQQRNLDESEQLFNTFLRDLERRPWIKHLIWWSFGVYTFDLEAMTWNNLGAIQNEKGRFADARPLFEKAITLDPKYPKPYFNLAIAAAAEGQTAVAEQYFNQARELGYSGGRFDRFLTQVQQEYAALQGK